MRMQKKKPLLKQMYNQLIMLRYSFTHLFDTAVFPFCLCQFVSLLVRVFSLLCIRWCMDFCFSKVHSLHLIGTSTLVYTHIVTQRITNLVTFLTPSFLCVCLRSYFCYLNVDVLFRFSLTFLFCFSSPQLLFNLVKYFFLSLLLWSLLYIRFCTSYRMKKEKNPAISMQGT